MDIVTQLTVFKDFPYSQTRPLSSPVVEHYLSAMIEPYLKRWSLHADGKVIFTDSSQLLPVIREDGTAAMLKMAIASDEKIGAGLMAWWAGDGAARVLESHENVQLLEMAQMQPNLATMARSGEDDEASRIICRTTALLHAKNAPQNLGLVPLAKRFDALFEAACIHGGFFLQPATIARYLLQTRRETVVLHGDIHHGNILWFGERGWLAIDPKGLIGERGFDYANLFCNPDMEIATAPGRLETQASLVAKTAHLDRQRLLQWIIAYCGLSAAWTLEQRPSMQEPFKTAGVAAAALALLD